MADPKNKWDQPVAPPPPMFFGKKERDLVKQVNDELSERVIGQPIAYYPISLEDSTFNDTYGEAKEKVSLPPVRVYAYVVVENEQTNERYGYEYQTKLTVNFHRKRLVDDQNLFVRVGDFVQYGEFFYEIVRTYNDTRYYFGQVEHKFQISAECVRARQGAFKVTPAVTRPTDRPSVSGEGQTPAPRDVPYPPLAASYITVAPERKLPNERVLTAGTGITLVDGGAGGAMTISAAGANAQGIEGAVQLQAGAGVFAGDSDLVFLTGSGRLGINVSAPTHSLTVVGTLSASSDVSFGSDLVVAGTCTLPGTIAGAAASTSSYLALDASNNIILTSSTGGGGGTAGGLTTQVQFNDAGAFAGSSNLTFNGITLTGSYTGSLAELTTISASAGRIAGDFHIDGTAAGAIASPVDGRLVFNNQYDSGGNTTANKIVLYESVGFAKYGIGISSGDFDLFAGAGGTYRFYSNHVDESSPGTEMVTFRSNGKVGIGESLPTRQLEVVGDIYGSGSIQINDPHGSTTVGTMPMARLIGNTGSSQTPETILRLSRKGISGQYYPAVADFNVSAYDVGGSPYGPYTQLDIALKDVGSWLESGSATVMSLRDNGNVGIGTRTPTHTLTTAGNTHLSGGLAHKHTTVASSYTASASDYILGVSAVPTEIEVNAASFVEGQVLVIKDESGAASLSDTILLSASAAQTIDGSTTATIESPYGSVLLYSNGSNWFIY